MTPFVILSTQRSGSTVLTRTLDEHPDIICAGELFHESKRGIHHAEWHFPTWKLIKKQGSRLNKIINYPNLRLNAVPHLKKFFKDDDTAKAKGFKLMYSQVKSAPFIWKHIVSNNIKVIVMVRRSAFRMALSRYRMSSTGRAHSNQVVQLSAITVPARSLLRHTLQLQGINDKMLSLSEDTDRLVLYYEDLQNWTNMMQQATAFLKVPFVHLQPVLKKLSGEDWRAEVTNHKEIEELFIENGAEQYLQRS